MTVARRRINGEVVAAAVVLSAACLELVVLAVAPRVDRTLATGVLLGAVAALVLAVGAIGRRRRSRTSASASGVRPPPDEARASSAEERTDPQWFEESALADFPHALLEPYLRGGTGSLGRHRLQAAWILARDGRDVRWLVTHLGLPSGVAARLVGAARSLPRGR